MEQKTTLVIMAAGIGSRFGKGVKQLTPVGPNGEFIIDYSIKDALDAGFSKVVFIIRRELLAEFEASVGKRTARKCAVAYAFQSLSDIPPGFEEKLSGREKPWGTAQAVLCARNEVKEPFAVINADDYYGKRAFQTVHDYLTAQADPSALSFCMAGYILKNTLSDFGSVTRGVVKTNAQGFLEDITETYHIVKTGDGAGVQTEDAAIAPIPEDSCVSMNMWGLTPALFPVLSEEFQAFLEALDTGDKKTEYLLPAVIGSLVKAQRASVRVLPTGDTWFGVTYREDKENVEKNIQSLIDRGVYPLKL